MSIIKGTNQIVAGFGGTKRSIGEVYFSQSSLATDNSGALPLFTGETIASANTIYPDFYNWVSAHTELQCTSAEYESALSTYGECPKYVLGGTTTKVTQINFSRLGYPIYTKNPTFTTDDDGNPYAKEQAYSDTNLTNQLANVEVVWQVQSGTTYTVYIIPNSTTGFAQTEITTDNNYENDSISYNYYSFTIYDGSIRLPKLSNYIKAANTAEGITQKEAGLPNITGYFDTLGAWYGSNLDTGGAFTTSSNQSTNFGLQGGSGTDSRRKNFDASRSSAVYGASDTVTPASTTLYPWVVAYTAAIPASTAQAAEFQQGLSGKADLTDGVLATGQIPFAEINKIRELNWGGMISWNASSVAPASGMAVFGGTGSDQQVYLKFKPAGSTTEYSINCGYNNDAGLSGTFILNPGDMAWTSNGCAGYFVPFK